LEQAGPCAIDESWSAVVFDLSITKLIVLGVLALIIFGPDQLPRLASQAGRALRDLRRIAESAKSDLQEGLGPEFSDFDLGDLNPRTFVRKHLWDEFDATNGGSAAAAPAEMPQPGMVEAGVAPPASSAVPLPAGPEQSPPYDDDAT
jgi:sec-independent protein translocase protein TatB